MALPKSSKKEQRQIPDPVQFLQSMAAGAGAGTGPDGFSATMTPGASGKTMPTQDSGAPQGFGGIPSHGPTPNGQKTPASKARGNGAKKTNLSPNNTKKAGSSTKGKPAYGMPSKGAIARRLHPVGESKAPSHTNASGRAGILAKFEGFSPNKN